MDRLVSEQAVIDAICKVCAVEIKPSECRYRKGLFGGCKEYEAIKAIPSAEPCEDAISRKALKHKLQEHHDFFVNAYGGFSNLPQNDKARVDEITNCIAMVVNEPPVNPQEPKIGHWVFDDECKEHGHCSHCGYGSVDLVDGEPHNYCPKCGEKLMVEPQERSDKE